MRHFKVSLVAFIAAIFSVSAAYAVELVIGSGGKGGTYYPVIEQIGEFCNGDSFTIRHFADKNGDTGGGSVANLRRILNNQAMGGIVQADVAHLEKMSNPAMSRILALLSLHREQVHVIAPTMASVLVRPALERDILKGVFTSQEAVYEMQTNPLNFIHDLKGRQVASWGGSLTSAKVISQMTDGGFAIVPVKDEGDALAMLDAGKVDAILAVAGAPVSWIEKLPKGKYKLLNVSDLTKQQLQSVYDLSGVSYDNLGVTGQQVKALSVDAILMTRTYRTPEMIKALGDLQKCVRESIFKIQDTPGTHPVWQTIDPSREPKWDNVFSAVAGR